MTKWLILALALWVTPAVAEQKVTLTMDQAEAQLLVNRLAEGPWREVNPLMNKLLAQINEQLKPPPKEGTK